LGRRTQWLPGRRRRSRRTGSSNLATNCSNLPRSALPQPRQLKRYTPDSPLNQRGC